MATRKRLKTCRGQGLTEYIIIVALVAIAAIGVVNIFGQQLRAQFATIVAAMAGKSLQLQADHSGAADKEAHQKTLQDYAAKPENK